MQLGKRMRLTTVNFQSIKSSTTTAPTMVMGCLKTSLLTLASACCMLRVSLAIRDMRKPVCIRLKKSIEWRMTLAKSSLRTSFTTLLLTQFM